MIAARFAADLGRIGPAEQNYFGEWVRFEGQPDARERLEVLSGRRRRIMVHDWCEGCGRCRDRCAQKAIDIVDGRAKIDQSRCVFCGYCARACPQFCIKVV